MISEGDDVDSVPPPSGPPRRATARLTDGWTQPAQAWQKYNLLSLDGGGVRGFWSLLLLNELMEQIASIEQLKDENVDLTEIAYHSFDPEPYPINVSRNVSEDQRLDMNKAERNGTSKARVLQANQRYLPCHYFDYVCGSSTGSLIAIMLSRFRMTVCDCLHEYKHLLSEIFGKPIPISKLNLKLFGTDKYSTSRVERVFRKVASDREDCSESRRNQTRFSSRKNVCKTFVTSLVSTCRKGSEPTVHKRYLIRSYDHMRRPRANNWIENQHNTSRADTDFSQESNESMHFSRKINYGLAEPMEVWQVARAATAAPLFFQPFDGQEHQEEKEFNRFIDGGAHIMNNPTWEGVQEVLELNGPESLSVVLSVGTARADKSPGKTIKRVLTNLVELGNNPETVESEVKRSSKAANGKFQYFRFNDDQGIDVEMDECQPRRTGLDTFTTIENHFYKWVNKPDIAKMIWRCAVLLVRQRRARIEDHGAWEAYSTGSEYRCPKRGCEDLVASKYKLQEHLKVKHGLYMDFKDERIKACKDVWCYRI